MVEKETGMENSKKEEYLQLDKHLPYQIDYTSNFNRSFRREFQSKYISDEITADEFAILFAITLNPNISQTELAKLLFKGKAHVGKILNDMENRNFLKRSATTRNKIIVKKNEITKKGSLFIEKGDKEFYRIKTVMDKEFSEKEVEQFIEYLKRFRTALNSILDVKLK